MFSKAGIRPIVNVLLTKKNIFNSLIEVVIHVVKHIWPLSCGESYVSQSVFLMTVHDMYFKYRLFS